MPPQRKSAYFQPTVPIPPQTILSLETELTHFRPRRSLLLETELRPFSLRNHAHPYQYPISRRGGTPEKDCLDWSQYPLTPAVAAAIRRVTDTTSVPPPPPPDPTRARSRQPTPGPGQPRSRQPTPAWQPTPGPSTTATGDSAELPSRPLLRRAKSVRFPTGGDDDDDEGQGQQEDKIATPELDGLISRPPGEVGRRGRGGFSLEVVLGWTTERFETVKKLVKSYVEDYLNHSMSMSNQPRGHVNSLIKLILAKHPGLVDQYRDGWPIREMIHLRLKYTSGRFKSGQPVPQGETYPRDFKKALKDISEGGGGKGKERN